MLLIVAVLYATFTGVVLFISAMENDEVTISTLTAALLWPLFLLSGSLKIRSGTALRRDIIKRHESANQADPNTARYLIFD